MPRRIICWEIADAFSKFGFEDGDGPNFTDEVAAAIEAAGPYRCRTQIWGLHNYAIEAIEEEVAPEEWLRVAEFDGYTLPPWESLPEPVRDALVALTRGNHRCGSAECLGRDSGRTGSACPATRPRTLRRLRSFGPSSDRSRSRIASEPAGS